MLLEKPNNLRYSLIVGATTTVLVSDPIGWSEESVARTRTEDNGVNSEITVPLSFVNDGYDLLQPIYASKGQFALAYLQIDKLDNNWDYYLFYKYRLDFSKCTDKLFEFEVPGIEEGLAVKFEKYKDTEYEVDLPSSNKVFIDYTGASYTDKNVIQCGFGDLGDDKEGIGDDNYVLKGKRSVRSYTDKLAFTDSDGLPYESMTFRALKSGTIPIGIFFNLTIGADPPFTFSTPASGNIVLLRHNANFTAPSAVAGASQINPSSSSTPSNNRIDNFTTRTTWNVTLVAGGIYSFFYRADNTKDYQSVSITEGSDCRVEFNVLTTNAYQNSKLECFTYEWLIAELLKKIDTNAAFESTITYPNVKELLSATPCIKNIGKTSGLGKLKTTLKDVLESYHKLKCTAIDITGNKMTIMPMADAYMKTDIGALEANNGELVAANITTMHDTKHQYNKVKVGADTDDREDDDPLIYPFICEKEFSVVDSLADAELNLVNNFMLDPYQIDKYVRDTNGDSDNKDECKFVIFACSIGSSFNMTRQSSWTDDTSGRISEADVISTATTQNFTLNQNGKVRFKVTTEAYHLGNYINLYSTHKISIYNSLNVIKEQYVGLYMLEEREFEFQLTKGTYYIRVENIVSKDTIDSRFITVYSYINGFSNIDTINLFEDNIIYKNHDKPITGFSGDSATIYNIPLTPKRILQRWQNYLAISLVGATTKDLKFGTATILNSAIESKCDYETEIVKENEDLSLTWTDPTFLPSLINFDTYNDYDRILADNPYGYYSLVDKKTSRTFKGFVNKTSYSVGANQTQQWELQAKEL